MEVVNIDDLTLEEYLALTRANQGPGLVRPAIGADVRFEIKDQFMRELRANPFSGNRDEDAYEHVENVLYITSLFNISGVSHDAIMLRVFPMTLTGAARRWIERLPAEAINTWALLKKHFIQRYCPPSKIYIIYIRILRLLMTLKKIILHLIIFVTLQKQS